MIYAAAAVFAFLVGVTLSLVAPPGIAVPLALLNGIAVGVIAAALDDTIRKAQRR